jgi:hypothetical protein
LLKIGALITVSVRRVYVRLASGFALKELFEQVLRALRALPQEAAYRRTALTPRTAACPRTRSPEHARKRREKAPIAFLAPPENPSTGQK